MLALNIEGQVSLSYTDIYLSRPIWKSFPLWFLSEIIEFQIVYLNINSLSQTLSVFLYRSLFLFLCTGISSLSSTSYLKEYTALEGSYAHHCTTNAGIHFSVPWGEKVSSFYSAGFISGIRFVPYCFIYHFFYTWNVPFWLRCHMA